MPPANRTVRSLMNDDYIARKERWARKMAGQEKPAVRSERRYPASLALGYHSA